MEYIYMYIHIYTYMNAESLVMYVHVGTISQCKGMLAPSVNVCTRSTISTCMYVSSADRNLYYYPMIKVV